MSMTGQSEVLSAERVARRAGALIAERQVSAVLPETSHPVFSGVAVTRAQPSPREPNVGRSHAEDLVAARGPDDPAAHAFAELANGLAQALMHGVQRVAELNIHTTRSLLAQGGSAANARLEGTAEAWRFSWRSYRICATTAATILKLCQSQARAGFDDLWRSLEDGLAQIPHADVHRLRETRTAFEAMRSAYAAYFDAALSTHRALLSLAAGAR